MKTLNLEQMEMTNGGSTAKVVGCTIGSILLVAAFAGLFTLTLGAGAVAIAAAAVTASLSPAGWGLACFTDY
jgi:carbonic anhydrase/acetyltransferase-like protein (isoleucine patch superfamily)